MISYSLIIIDDDRMVLEAMASALDREYDVRAFTDAKTAIESLREGRPDLILLDIALPGMNGVRALEIIKKQDPSILIIMISAFDDIETVIAAMKMGAHDYLVKPIHTEALEVTIKKALDTIKLRKEVHQLQEKFLRENLPCFIGESRAIHDVMEFFVTVAKSPDTPVLILGETGTGKELIASAIHYRSPNFRNSFVPVNCASIPRDLLESELFGYEKGAFSGASSSGKKGLIEESAGGTLFLDEVGDLNFDAQAKLLRFLEEGEFYRVGSTKRMKVQTRVVSATNRNLEQMISQGLFRKDLYYRLGVVTVEIPSLNHRREDILPLARYFLVDFSQKMGKRIIGIGGDAERALQDFNWEGNVRELRNLIERAVLVSQGPELTLPDLGIAPRPESISAPSPQEKGLTFPPLDAGGINFPAAAKLLEKYYLDEALKFSGGNESKAAELLNLNHHTFRYRYRKFRTS